MAFKYPIEGAVILGTTQCQHLIAVDLISPGTRTLALHMTHELIGRCDTITAQRIAPATALAIVRSLPKAHTGQIAKHGLGLVIGHYGDELGGRVLHVELLALWYHTQCLIQRRHPTAAGPIIEESPVGRKNHRMLPW
jgi:hypothetical protein